MIIYWFAAEKRKRKKCNVCMYSPSLNDDRKRLNSLRTVPARFFPPVIPFESMCQLTNSSLRAWELYQQQRQSSIMMSSEHFQQLFLCERLGKAHNIAAHSRITGIEICFGPIRA